MHFCFLEMTASVILIWMVSESSCGHYRVFSMRKRDGRGVLSARVHEWSALCICGMRERFSHGSVFVRESSHLLAETLHQTGDQCPVRTGHLVPAVPLAVLGFPQTHDAKNSFGWAQIQNPICYLLSKNKAQTCIPLNTFTIN